MQNTGLMHPNPCQSRHGIWCLGSPRQQQAQRQNCLPHPARRTDACSKKTLLPPQKDVAAWVVRIAALKRRPDHLTLHFCDRFANFRRRRLQLRHWVERRAYGYGMERFAMYHGAILGRRRWMGHAKTGIRASMIKDQAVHKTAHAKIGKSDFIQLINGLNAG